MKVHASFSHFKYTRGLSHSISQQIGQPVMLSGICSHYFLVLTRRAPHALQAFRLWNPAKGFPRNSFMTRTLRALAWTSRPRPSYHNTLGLERRKAFSECLRLRSAMIAIFRPHPLLHDRNVSTASGVIGATPTIAKSQQWKSAPAHTLARSCCTSCRRGSPS